MDTLGIKDAAGCGCELSLPANMGMLDEQLIIGGILSRVPSGEITEDYPDDKPMQICLLYGNSTEGDPVHGVWGYNAREHFAVLITVYRPDPGRWIEWRARR